MPSPYLEKDYKARINRVIDYIQGNLDKKLSLTELSTVACFSPFHFHRIFRAFVGETLNDFIQRIRVEKAAQLLLTNPGKSITEIAFETGFSSSASFARLFNSFYGMSASTLRKEGAGVFGKNGKSNSKIGKTESNNGKYLHNEIGYINDTNDGNGANSCNSYQTTQSWREFVMSIKTDVIVKQVPAMTVAYIRHIGPYKGDGALFGRLWGQMMQWAGPRGFLEQPDLKCLCMYHDDPEITDEKNLRLSICISVPEHTKVDGEIGKMNVEGGKYAIAHFEINADQYQQAWDYVYREWLPGSGYQPDDRPCYERCLNDVSKDPLHKHIIDIYVPVKPA